MLRYVVVTISAGAVLAACTPPEGKASDARAAAAAATPSETRLGIWYDVTPPGISLDPTSPKDNYGVMDVVVDPRRPNELYVFVCYQGVWKSVDYGATWNKVSEPGSILETGRPWTALMVSVPSRDPRTPPVLYTANGYGAELGVFTSHDGGVHWSRLFAGQDVYSFDVDPYDHRHLLTGMHEAPGLAESTDAGATWRTLHTHDIGVSIYPWFIDTGNPETTRATWLLVPQTGDGHTAAITGDAGRTFRKIEGMSHAHGANQLFRAGPGLAYVGATGGVWRTADSGATFERLEGGRSPHPDANGVVGTPRFLYAWDSIAYANGNGGAFLRRSPREPGTAWERVDSPARMNNGAKRVAVTSHAGRHVLVSGNWNAGVWRYVEP